MRAPLIWLRLRWPREIDNEWLIGAWRILARIAGQPVVVEAIGTNGTVAHRLAVSYSKQQVVMRQLRSVLPGLDVTEDDGPSARPPLDLNLAVSVVTTTRNRALNTDQQEAVSRAVITALASTRKGEVLVLQWILGRPLLPRAVPSRSQLPPESWTQAILGSLRGVPATPDAERRRALATKRSEAGWRAIGRIAVTAADDHRRRHLLSQLLGALRTAEAPGVQLTARKTRSDSVEKPDLPLRWTLRLNVLEVAAVSGWPVGKTSELPVATMSSRLLRPSRLIPSLGKIVVESSFPGEQHPLALSTSSALRHLHVMGPTGVGKSTVLLNLINQDIAAGHSVVVIEPKGDLIEDVLGRIPDKRLDDVVLLDPSDDIAPVGLNPLEARGRPPELVADQLLAVFHRLYAAHWGPRTHDILGNALATLTQIPDMTLCALPLLLADPHFRRQVVGRIHDPIGLEPFWAAFEAWSEPERTAATAPVQNKLRPFLVNPRLRAVLGQAHPRFDMSKLFSGRTILLVNLAKGQIGPEAANLLGSLVMAQLWQASLGRSAVPADRRKAAFVYVDEFQDYLNLPVDLAEALGQARGLGVGLVLAHQHLFQLDPAMRSAVLANARSRLCFQLAMEDAQVMARGNGLEPADFMDLPSFECYVRLVAGEAVQPWCSARSLPPPPITMNPSRVRQISRDRYGTPLGEVEAAITALVGGQRQGPENDDLSPRRRHGGTP